MDKFETNLISMMVEETMDSASVYSVIYDRHRSCYMLTIHGYLIEIPENWSSLFHLSSGAISLPEDFVQVLNDELSCQFEEVKIVPRGDSLFVLEIKTTDYNLYSMPKAA
jgi:hypothetical protein